MKKTPINVFVNTKTYRPSAPARGREKAYRAIFGSCALTFVLGAISLFLPIVFAAQPFGTNLGSFNNVAAISNGSSTFYSGQSNTVNGIYTGIKWQCVEYVRRYYLSTFGLNLGALYRGNANTWYDNAAKMGLDRFPNGSTVAPQVGDIITSNGGSFGHVAIIRSVTGNQVCTVQQNFSNDATDINRCLSLTVSNGSHTVGGFSGSYPIRGWLRKPGTTAPPPCSGGNSENFRVNAGPPLHPNGTLVKERNNGTVYVIQNGQRRPISSPDVLHFLYTGENGEFDFSDVITVAADELSRYPVGEGVFSSLPPNGRSQPDGRLIKQVGGGEISIVTDNGKRRPFSTENVFLGLGYQYCGVVEVSDYGSYPVGPIVEGKEALPTVSTSISLSPAPPHSTGQSITARFSLTNRGNAPVTFDTVTAGGRLNGSVVSDFSWDSGILINAGQTYNYQRTRSFSEAGSYTFFPAVRFTDGTWKIGLNNEIGVDSGVTATSNTTLSNVQAPTVTTGSATSITSTGATVGGSINPNGSATTAWYEWGTTSDMSAFNSTTSQSVGTGTAAVSVSANLSGLAPNTTYFYRLAGSNSGGTSKGTIFSFTTLSSTPPPPAINQPTNVTQTNSTLNWSSVAGATEYRVQVSTTSSFSTSADGRECFNCIPNGNQIVSAPTTSLSLTELTAGTTYFWRVRAGRFVTVSEWTTDWSTVGSFTTTAGQIQVTVQTNPSGRSFAVDGVTHTTPQTFNWTPGSSHTISTSSPQSGSGGTRYVWGSWTDGGAISHTVAPASSTTYTANFSTEHLLTMNAGTGGSVSPSSGWFNSGQGVNISATPNSGFVFSGWSGTGTGSFTGTSNPASVTMNGPVTQSASFTAATTPTPTPTPTNLTNLALSKTATQSSDPFGASPGRAVDGNVSGNWGDNSLTHTNLDAQAWWQVDLGSVQSINDVKVFNRTDCCSERLSDFYVLVSDSPFTSTDLTATLNQVGVSGYHTAGAAGPQANVAVARTGRYVRVQLTATNYLSLAEVQVWGTSSLQTNLAHNKPATQSSDPFGASPGRAVDGNTSGNWSGNSVTHTDLDAQAWWQVDLGSVQSIQSVNVWNRTDCCADRLGNFYVLVSDVPFTSTDLTASRNQAGVSSFLTPGVGGAPTAVSVNRTGRYVRVQLSGTNYLALAEVQVFGGSQTPTHLAQGKPATQSSDPFGGPAARAADGNTSGDWSDNSVTHTNNDAQAWWQVDLGSVQSIATVRVWNRTDCCGSRLSNFHVLVSDAPFTSTDLTTTLNQSGVSSYFTAGVAGAVTEINVGRTGRYVRVQLSGTGYLSLAEVQVWAPVSRPGTLAPDGTGEDASVIFPPVFTQGTLPGAWHDFELEHRLLRPTMSFSRKRHTPRQDISQGM